MKKRNIFGYSILILIIVLMVVFLWLPSHNKAEVTVVNNSGESIKFLSISLFPSHGKCSVKNLSPTGSFEVEFYNFSDSHYVLKGELQNGTKIEQELGYVTNGIDFKDTITIEKNGNAVLANSDL